VTGDQRAYQIAQAEAKAKAEAILKELQSALSVSVVNKGFKAPDFENFQYESYITVDFTIKNRGAKAIRAFKGIVSFQTLMGGKVIDTPLELDKAIRPNSALSWTGALTYNQFMDEDQKLKNTDLKDLKVIWRPESILFADGSKLVASESENNTPSP